MLGEGRSASARTQKAGSRGLFVPNRYVWGYCCFLLLLRLIAAYYGCCSTSVLVCILRLIAAYGCAEEQVGSGAGGHAGVFLLIY